jgi:hypothetical protein
MGQSAAETDMAVGVTEGGLTVGASADMLKRRIKYKLWPHLHARILS